MFYGFKLHNMVADEIYFDRIGKIVCITQFFLVVGVFFVGQNIMYFNTIDTYLGLLLKQCSAVLISFL